jgi:hypothetical protein
VNTAQEEVFMGGSFSIGGTAGYNPAFRDLATGKFFLRTTQKKYF